MQTPRRIHGIEIRRGVWWNVDIVCGCDGIAAAPKPSACRLVACVQLSEVDSAFIKSVRNLMPAPAYPLTAPEVSPCMNSFCMERYKRMMGSDASITFANTRFHIEVYAPMAL